MRLRAICLALLVSLSAAAPAFAVRPGEQLPDATQEARARRISAELRCLVCQNQSIDDSDASLATDLRRLVRERIAAGDSDQSVLDFIVARYGEFVLLKPSFSTQTLILWGLPVVALLLGGMAAFRLFRRVRAGEEPSGDEAGKSVAGLSETEQQELAKLIAQKSLR
ncbi:MAG: cytochrome c-type biogenesis protein CcmH [Rhizobiales bacterium PAR1]|nr:MAG: cytochrome c-type biogenesis protein CcmH [Rhizobiales bacterium PAR1]